jgi:hypothetical protein
LFENIRTNSKSCKAVSFKIISLEISSNARLSSSSMAISVNSTASLIDSSNALNFDNSLSR